MENNSNKELYHTLKRLNRLMHRLGHHGPGEHGLHRGQVHLLKTIQQNEGIIQRDLAELIDIRPSSLTEALLRMEQEGLAERRQDERDQRLMHIYLTDLGGMALEALDESDDPFNDSLLNCLTAEESASMVALCNKLCDSLERTAGADDEKHHGRRGRHCRGECGHDHHGEEHHGECKHGHHDEEHHGECKHGHHDEEHHGECKHGHHDEEHHGECRHEHHDEEHHGECKHGHHDEEHHHEHRHDHDDEEHHGECKHGHHDEEHHGECRHGHHDEEHHGECRHEHHDEEHHHEHRHDRDEEHHSHHRHHGQPDATEAAGPTPDAGAPA